MKLYNLLIFFLFIPFLGFSQNVGIGTTTPAYKLDIFSDTLDRALNVVFNSPEPTAAVYGLRMSAVGSTSSAVSGADFISNSLGEGDSYALQARAFMLGSGTSYGIRALNQATVGHRYGIYSDITGVTNGIATSILGKVSGKANANRPVTAIYGIVDEFATNGSSYAIRGVNHNAGGYSAWLQGKARIVDGEFASLSSGGFLQIGNSVDQNLVFDGNEIIGRNNGSTGSIYMQFPGGNVYMCPLSGQVAIGVLNSLGLPSSEYKLAVGGKGVFEELRVDVQADWPDYVFEETYDMLPLSQLKTYVQNNKHLPNIPSAKEVKEGGLMLGEMQYRMMEKIEELTLYIIEQNERIEKLERQLLENSAENNQ